MIHSTHGGDSSQRCALRFSEENADEERQRAQSDGDLRHPQPRALLEELRCGARAVGLHLESFQTLEGYVDKAKVPVMSGVQGGAAGRLRFPN